MSSSKEKLSLSWYSEEIKCLCLLITVLCYWINFINYSLPTSFGYDYYLLRQLLLLSGRLLVNVKLFLTSPLLRSCFCSSCELGNFSELRLTVLLLTVFGPTDCSAMWPATLLPTVLLSNLNASASFPSRFMGENCSPSMKAWKLKSYSSECAQLSDRRNGLSSCFSTSASSRLRRNRDW